jgi:glycosyltransferase involved in cell wall biosynthesis
MIILHCISNISGGGAEKQLHQLSIKQAAIGNSVHIIYLNNNNNSLDYRNSGVTLWKINAYHNYDLKILYEVLILIKSINPNIVQSWITQMDIICGILIRIYKFNWIIREPSNPELRNYGFKLLIRIFLAKRAKYIITNSNSALNYWQKKLNTAKIKKINNVITIPSIIKNENISEEILNKPIVIYIGRINNTEKNFDAILKAFIRVSKYRDVNFCIVGNGPNTKKYKDIIELGNNKHQFFFFDNSENVWGWMKVASLLVNASFVEGQPNIVLEAMASNLPVVLSDISAHNEIACPETAFFVDLDFSSIARGIILALDNIELCKYYSNNAFKKIQEILNYDTVNEYLKIYNEIK